MDPQRYSLLLNSVARLGTGSTTRPLTPVECAESIKRLIDEEGDSLEQVAARLNLGKPNLNSGTYAKRDTTLVSWFLNLLRVSPKSQSLVGWGTEDYPKIPFSTVAQLVSFSPEDQDIILQSVFVDGKKRLGKEDVKMIRKWKNGNPGMPIRECLSNVLKLKPVTVTTHMIVCNIRDNLQKIIESDAKYQETLIDFLKKKIGGEFYAVHAGRNVVAISMDEHAYGAFKESQYGRGVSYTEFLEDLLENDLG